MADGGQAVEQPALSLPAGGGALRGIGERFSVNPATGTASFRVPLNVSAGRSGFGPELSLNYDSGRGNGPFGFGWHLSPPTISRRTDSGVPGYTGADVFLLADADELVAVGVAQERLGHRVECFRPRVERDFARIERWARLADGDVHWRRLSKDNVLTIYGLDERARVHDPADPRRVFSWLMSHSYDDVGNAIVYEYVSEDAAGVDLTVPAERSRTRGAVRYLKRIRYGNRRPLLIDPAAPSFRAAHVPAPAVEAADWMFEVVLDYGEGHYGEDAPDEHGRVLATASAAGDGTAWPVRADSFSSYRAGFEQRMHRLCRRVLMFHRFPELGTAACLVHATELGYAETPTGSFLTAVEERGFRTVGEERYLRRSRPALELKYSTSPLDDPGYVGAGAVELDGRSAENLAVASDGLRLWVDLDGDGADGVLSRDGGAWFYKANAGDGRLGPAQLLELQPLPADRPAHQPIDLTGNGSLDMVALSGPTPGVASRIDGRFMPLRPFESAPQVDWGAARLVDLVGDGLADLLVAEGDELRWHRSLGTAGFAPSTRIELAGDDVHRRPLHFASATEALVFADMTGDGLSDIVWVREGEVCYRPSLGHGRFGALVAMERSPVLEPDGRFDPQRVLLADTDGSGTADLIYLGARGVQVHLNLCGNGWSEPRVLHAAPPARGATSATVGDLLGRGTACLIWCSELAIDERRPVRYLDLAGGVKPHLLVAVKNNLGAETRVSYTPSTTFFLDDKRAGKPWMSRLPFPVQVVERVETLDRVGRNRYVQRYSYHHGHFDARTREFRGFGRVDQYDTEELAALAGSPDMPDALNVDAASYVPPVRTRRWFHTGAPAALDGEYAGAALTRIELPADLAPDALAHASEALMGVPLRTEVCGLDGSERLYTIRESGQAVDEIEPGVYQLRETESIEIDFDSDAPQDSRVTHHVLLDVDAFGTPLLAASISYGRRGPAADPLLSPEDVTRQGRTYVTYAVARCTNAVSLDDAHRAPAVAEHVTYELLHAAPAGDRFTAPELRAAIAAAADHDLAFDDFEGNLATEPGPHRRLTSSQRALFRANDLSRALPLGEVEALALPAGTHRLALTPALAESLYVASGKLAPDALEATLSGPGGYVHSEDDAGWWVPSEQATYATAGADELETAIRSFFRPRRWLDALGAQTLVEYDDHALLPVARVDAVGNRVEVVNDYRVLEAASMLDENGNRSAIAFDALGEVAGTAVGGKPGEPGDSLDGFDPDLSDAVVAGHLADPSAAPATLLGPATTRRIVSYASEPAAVVTLTRETHGADTAIQQRIAYSDGLGHEVQVKTCAAPGSWQTEGWKIFDNKGQPVRQYEPFLDDIAAFRFAPSVGASAIVFRDPRGRVAAVAHPHRAWEKVVDGPWRAETWDVNDTVLLNPADDEDAEPYFRRLPADAYLPTWYAARIDGELGPAEQRAASAAAAHASTPKAEFRDALGRVFLTVLHNRAGTTDEHHRRVELGDSAGYVRCQLDELGRECARFGYDLMGHRVHTASMDNGARWMLLDARGSQIRAWDARGHEFVTTVDGLRRVLTRSVRGTDPERSDPRTLDREVVYERLEYGEERPGAAAANLRTRLVRMCDGAGVLTTDRFDFRGNCLRRAHQLVTAFDALADWSGEPELEPDAYVGEATYDAVNRPARLRSADGSVLVPSYDGLGRLATLDVQLPAESDPTRFVEGVTYDAHGQRTQIRFGNGAQTDYEYDAATFRLTRQLTTRRAAGDEFASAVFASPTTLQDIRHVYDPSGNLLELSDDAQRTTVARGQVIDAGVANVYDAVYRLVETSGREQAQLGDLGSLRRYAERYELDLAGNVASIAHAANGGGNWRRDFAHGEPSALEPTALSNRLSREDERALTYDDHGCVTSMAPLTLMRWDFKDQLAATARQVGDDPETTAYAYDALGTRRRKVTTRRDGSRRGEWLYLGEVEIYREFGADGTTVSAQRSSLQLLDERRRIALVDVAAGAAPAVRYQLSDHLDSATIELDRDGAVITYEEYGAYGTVLVSGGRTAAETGLKRYRFTGKENDRETGLNYHGARYYAPWLARWISCDPEALALRREAGAAPEGSRPPGWNPYLYARDNPYGYTDPTGRLDTWGRVGIATGVTLAPIALLLGTGLILDAANVQVPGSRPEDHARWVGSSEGAVGDPWIIGHYGLPAAIAAVTAIIMTACGVDPNVTFVVAGALGQAEAYWWETVERDFMAARHQQLRRGGKLPFFTPENTKEAALEWRTNTLFEDIVLGSIASYSWAFLVPFLVGRPPDAGLVLTYGVFMQFFQLSIGYELVYGGHIPTRDTHIYDPEHDQFLPRPPASASPAPATPGP